MSLHDEIKAHAKLFAKDVQAGKVTVHSRRARDFMGETPDAVPGVIDLVHRAANRKTRNEAMIQAYVWMFASGLEGIRYQVERGHDWAEELLDAIRELLFLLAKGGVIKPDLLLSLLNGFVEAKLAPGDDLTELLGDVGLETVEDLPESALSDISTLFETIIEQSGGNAFDVYAAIAEISKALPPAFRMAALQQIATSDNPVLRDAAILHLLDAAPDVRRTACQLVTEHASPTMVSPAALRRMVALRNWLPENERHHLDTAIKTSRRRKVDCAPWPERRVEEIVASNMDGAGAQSVFAVARDGRKHVIASLLVKQGVGIADAWCMRDQSKAEVRAFLGQIHAHTQSHRVDTAFLQRLIPHYLAVGQNSGNVPMAGLLDFVEATAIETWQPRALANDALISLLEQDIEPSRINQAAVARVIEKSEDLLDMCEFLESWFEEDAEVDAILAKSSKARTQTKVNTIMKSVLEPRRAKWTDRFLWTALWLKQTPDVLSPWVDFLVVGRELHRGRPIKDIPVMRGIAEETVLLGAMRF